MAKSVQNAEIFEYEWDHRKIGRELELFSFHEEGPGSPFFLPNGLVIRNVLIALWRRLHRGYREIQSPLLLDKKLWERSGHWDLYRENMFVSEVDRKSYAIKPMNCPGAILYYQEKRRSHADLPFRVCEMGRCHRNEKSGALHGLFRVRSFVVDDGHIFCARDQLLSEVSGILSLAVQILNCCGFHKLHFELSVRSEQKKSRYLGDGRDWEFAEEVLQHAIRESGFSYRRMEGEAKFYGPAIDIMIEDSAGRKWQCSSIQMDFNLPERFDISYQDHSGRKKRPYILHRCLFGSLERFIGVLLEHYRGRLPMWLAPVQVRVIPVSNLYFEYCEELKGWLGEHGLRVDLDIRESSLSDKIKRSEKERVPIQLVIGQREIEQGRVSLRYLGGKQSQIIQREDFISLIQSEGNPPF